jgi:branched-chain amino acid transport system permease protein
VFQTYVPTRWAEVPAILFGLGAISVAKDPDGVVVKTGRQLRQLVAAVWPAPRRTPGRVTAPSSVREVRP